ncbi:DcaP family trimeric outer membrane transporter [Brevundimonas sp.]|uniref:DcaP family trimeric outer membrane transporter n=1 Tax=Brevundimonas sp. TaxID=1871086 RepID=UPI002ED9E547
MTHPQSVAWIAAAALAGATPALAQAPPDAEALALEVIELRQAVAALQARLDAIDSGRQAQANAIPVSIPVSARMAAAPDLASGAGRMAAASVLPTRYTFGDELTGVARADTAAPPNDPDLRGFISVPGSQTMVRFGGFAKVNAIFDFAPAGSPDRLITSVIPIGAGDGRNTSLDANNTRFSFEARRPSAMGPMRVYLENDFYGGGGGTAFRLRQAHGQIGNTYAGYGYTAFADADAFPDTLDDEGPGGGTLVRVAAIRQIWKLGGGATAALSIEDPASELMLTTGRTAAQPAPDVVGVLRLERPWGHVQTSAVTRLVGYSEGDRNESAFGYGLSLSGLFKLGDDFAMAGFTYGDGLGRYFNDLSGAGYDGLIQPDGDVRTLAVYGGYLGYTRHWSPRWRSNLVGGILVLDRDDLLAPTAFRSSGYGAANLIWAVSPSFSVGVEVLYGRHELQNGQDADVTRLQASLKYDFVQ